MPDEAQVQVRDLQAEIERLRARLGELEHNKRALEEQLDAASVATEAPPPITTQSELQNTLRLFVKKVAMILQADKCVIMLYDKESGELQAQAPAFGLTDEEVRTFRVRATHGVSGEAFRQGEPIICDDMMSDPRTVKENVALLKVRNGLTVPLTLEFKDENQEVIERQTIGVLHVFNKRGGGSFEEEDVRLLTVLARSAASVISNAQIFIAVTSAKEQLEFTFQSMLSGVLVVDVEGRILLMNSAARRIFGVPHDDGTGQSLVSVVSNETVQSLVSASLEDAEEKAQEVSLYTPGERIFQVQTALLRGESSAVTGVVATFNDITELRNVERMKTEFVASVSHELRTPLTSIKGFVRTLLDDTDGYYDRDTQVEFYQIIDQECDRLVRLINDLLNVSRIEAGRALELNLKPVDLRNLIAKVVASQESYTTRHHIQMDVPEALPTVIADDDKIDQILTNLINNAIKYSPDGGDVVVSARATGGNVEVSVADQGIGIPPDHMDKIFARFHRVEGGDTRRAGGTGIGLFLVKHLVEAHAGRIWVESEPGKGSTFTFAIPLKAPAEPGAAPEPSE
ncbi:MAG: GAF domain-containing protein [Armatimonadota bacterium]|nr:MAG: GAF domain-containing protein [Armatimonadota bacterium]